MCNCKCRGAISSRGPKGDTGATGATGATGPAGADGADGADGDSGVTSLDYSWAVNGAARVLTASTSSAVLARIVFEGSTYYLGSPTQMTVISHLNSAFVAGTGTIEIYDETNGVQVGITAAINSSAVALYNIPITGAIPAGQAIWAIRGDMSIADNEICLAALSIRF